MSTHAAQQTMLNLVSVDTEKNVFPEWLMTVRTTYLQPVEGSSEHILGLLMPSVGQRRDCMQVIHMQTSLCILSSG